MRRRPIELWIALALMLGITAIYAAVTAALSSVPAASGLFGHGMGILGFILASRYDPSLASGDETLWLTTWKVRPDFAHGLGLVLLRSDSMMTL